MRKLVPLHKQSKKQRKEYNAKQRGSWNGISPVTRIVPNGKAYGRCVEAIKFYLALKHAGLPVIIYGAEFIKKRLLGLERVGIVPNEVMPFYCHSRFPGEDVDSFRHLNHENPDAEIALIEWQPIKPVKLKENAHE